MNQPIAFDTGKILLALSSPKTLRKWDMKLISMLLDSGYELVIVAVNRPASVLSALYERHGLDTARISYIDTITKYSLGTTPEIPRTRFVAQPGDLTAIGIALTEMLKERDPEKTILFLDSVNAMLIYISSANITRFLHFLSSKLRLMNLGGIFLAVERGLDPVLMSLLTSFADGILEEEDEREENAEQNIADTSE